MAESSLEKLVRLATENVKTYQRFERGKNQVVPEHTATYSMDPRGAGYIPEPKWKAGQQEYVAKGEADWKARGAQHAAAARAHEAAADAAQHAAAAQEAAQDAAKHATSGPAAFASSKAAAAGKPDADKPVSGPGAFGSAFAGPKTPPRRGGTLQDFVHSIEGERQAYANKLNTNPLFTGSDQNAPAAPGAMPPATTEAAISTAADIAVDQAAIKSGSLSADDVAALRKEMADMEQRLFEMHQQELEKTKTAAVGEAATLQDKLDLRRGRAALTLNLLGIVASILVAAVSGGVGAIIAEVMAAKWTVEVAKEITSFFTVEKGYGQETLAHPVAKTAKAAKTAKKTVLPPYRQSSKSPTS